MSLQRIPFEKQHPGTDHRMCGAAALSMVYRSLDLSCSQQEAWGEVAQLDRTGRLAAMTHLLARDATRRGLAAVVVQATDPWAILGRAVAGEVRVILNHRLKTESSWGHYTVLVDVDDELSQGDRLGEIESVKTMSDVYMPVNGKIIACNEAIEKESSLVNSDPYGNGWLLQIEIDGDLPSDFMDAAAYRESLGE